MIDNTQLLPQITVQPVVIAEASHPCLFGLGENLCSYDPSSLPVYLSLGEALAAVALLLAVYQLANIQWKLNWEIRPRWKIYTTYGWLVLGGVFTLIASLAPSLPLETTPLISYPIFWEILAFTCFVVSPISLLWMARNSKGVFKKNTSKAFYASILKRIGRGKSEEIEACVNALMDNIQNILDAVKQVDDMDMGKNTGETFTEMERWHQIHASKTLNIFLTDTKVADYIATSRVDFIVLFLDELQKRQIKSHNMLGVKAILERLLHNPNSYLYRQLDNFKGLAMEGSLFDKIFSSEYLIEEFMPLSEWKTNDEQDLIWNINYIKVHLKALTCMVEQYDFNKVKLTTPINFALQDLLEYIMTITWTGEVSEADKRRRRREILNEIVTFLSSSFLQFYESAVSGQTINDFEREASRTDSSFSLQQPVSTNYAFILADCLGWLSLSSENDGELKMWVDKLTYKLFSPQRDSLLLENIRTTALEFWWLRIDGNIVNGLFPSSVRSYLLMIPFISALNLTRWMSEEKRKAITMLYDDFLPRILANETLYSSSKTKEEEFLPDFIRLDRARLKFFYRLPNGNEIEIIKV